MGVYADMQQRVQTMINEGFKGTVFFAFSEEQFKEGMAEIGAKSEKELYRMPGGGFYKKMDSPKIKQLFSDAVKIQKAALKDGGVEFAADMFSEELANHEYGLTRDLRDTLDAIGIEPEEIWQDEALSRGLEIALAEYGESLFIPE